MPDYPQITLRYFDRVRGRGQFLRNLLTVREVPFTESTVVLNADRSSWREARKDRSISGDFQKLPTLQWGDTCISEVLPILGFLHEALGDAERGGSRHTLRHAMLCSSVFLDLLTPCINLVWCSVLNPGVDIPRTVPLVKGKMELHLETVEQTLNDWHWLDGLEQRKPLAADVLLWESLDVIQQTFDGKVGLERHDSLRALYQHCPGTDTFRGLLREKSPTLTARPGEAEALDLIHRSI